MRVDQLRVDPVLTALRQPFDVQLARSDHHLTQGTVNHVAVDVDIRKFVIRADGLDLTQRILQGAPVPQTDVLNRRLVIREVDRLDACFGGKRLPHDAIEPVRPARELDVVRDVRGFAHQLVRLHDEAADVRCEHADDHVADDGGYDRGDEPSNLRRGHRIHERHRGAKGERDRHDQHAGEGHVVVGVRHAAENRTAAIVEQLLEAAEIHARRQHQEDDGETNRQAAPGGGALARTGSTEEARAAADHDEEAGHGADQDSQRQKPTGDHQPRGKREQIEIDRLREDRIEKRCDRTGRLYQ